MSSDPEKNLGMPEKTSVNLYDSMDPSSSSSGADAEIETTKLNFIDRWAHKLNAETKGIELVTDEEKTDTSFWNLATMWLSANLVIATFSLGALGISVF